jgi:hypothetical protein
MWEQGRRNGMSYGRAQMEARNTASSSVEARVKPTTLATLAMWFEAKGQPARTKSELVRMGLEVLEEYLIANDQVPRIASTEEALMTLASMGFDGLNRNSRGTRALMQQLQREEKYGMGLEARGIDTAMPINANQYYDPPTGMLYFSTIAKLTEMGYIGNTAWDGNDKGVGLPKEAWDALKANRLPRPCPVRVQEVELPIVPQAPLDRPETLEEAQARREAEAAREKMAMMEAIRARRGGIDNAKD